MSRWAAAGRPFPSAVLLLPTPLHPSSFSSSFSSPSHATPPLRLPPFPTSHPCLPSPRSVCHNSFSSLFSLAPLSLDTPLSIFRGTLEPEPSHILSVFADGVASCCQHGQTASRARVLCLRASVGRHVPPGPESTAGPECSWTSRMTVLRDDGSPEETEDRVNERETRYEDVYVSSTTGSATATGGGLGITEGARAF